MRSKNRFTTSLGFALAFTCLLALVAGPVTAGEPAAPAKAFLTKVEAKRVCMVNNMVFDKDQIPVQVEERTYFGCCEMCKERLAKDASARTAVDPVTGKPVDKAKAVIGALPDGSVVYFESQASFDRYTPAKEQ